MAAGRAPRRFICEPLHRDVARKKVLVEGHSEFLICRPIFRRFEHKNVGLGPVPFASQMRLESHALHGWLFQVFEARSGFAETNNEPRELQFLLQFGDFNRNDLGRNLFRFRQMGIPIPSPRSTEGNQKNRERG
jgi:hypothetical protein